LDQELVERGLCESRTQAQRSIMAGQVRVNGHPANKSGDRIKPGDSIELLTGDRYVSRGGHKLEHGLTYFEVKTAGVRALDVGSSTGGFTDCLLQHGAVHVHAVDVGTNQLAWKLRQDPRVTVMEKTNARHLTTRSFGANWQAFDLIVADCSFISLRLVLPPIWGLLSPGGLVVALIKPQFEAGKEEADRGAGVIRDPAVHARVITELEQFTKATFPDAHWRGTTESPLLGPAGNKEFLAAIERKVS
jgi:23S rRNA (cytidine1920-2'-O)/16S rRNA (cytidine1409-2'-O)-methyltransferase